MMDIWLTLATNYGAVGLFSPVIATVSLMLLIWLFSDGTCGARLMRFGVLCIWASVNILALLMHLTAVA